MAKISKAEKEVRVNKFAEIIANGGRRSDCVKYAAEKWGLQERACQPYLKLTKEKLKADFDIERPQMVAELLNQAATLQVEARKKGHLHIALGAINTAARLAQIVS
tara:strand:+ start:55 stop:372 length:318 start_codon:yes stop_codon:yes gene_type:complete